MNTAFIVNDIFKKILNRQISSFDRDYRESKGYLGEVRAFVYELQNFKMNFLEEGSAGNAILSFIVFNKIPPPLKKELIHKVGTVYPNLNHILDNFQDAISVILSTSSVKPKSNEHKFKINSLGSNFQRNPPFPNKNDVKALQNYQTAFSPQYHNSNVSNSAKYYSPCKLCLVSGHSTDLCRKYRTLEDRIARADALGLSHHCAAVAHESNACFGLRNKLKFACFHCKQYSHISAFCPFKHKMPASLVNLSFYQSFDRNYILPTLTIELVRGNKIHPVRCIIDTASERSYISGKVAKIVYPSYNDTTDVNYNIQTFIGCQTKSFKQAMFGIKISKGLNFFYALVDRQ